MIRGFVRSHLTTASLKEALLEDRALLDDMVWQLFEHEGGGELSLAAHDKYSRGVWTWSHALKDLASAGDLDRQRLLSASLDALAKDYAQFRAGWFSRFHESLEPTLDEQQARLDAYLKLLSSPVPPTVKFALTVIQRLWKKKRVPHDAFVHQLAPVVFASAKSTALSGLKLLAACAEDYPAVVVESAIPALEHPNSDVQKRALELLESLSEHLGVAEKKAIAERATGVVAPLRSRAQSLTGLIQPQGTQSSPPAPLTVPDVPAWCLEQAGLGTKDTGLWGNPIAPGGFVPQLVERDALFVPDTVEETLTVVLETLTHPEDSDRVESALA
ncbi:MAG: DUF6493 family protein, partial [Myxococcota bacterium]